MNLCTDTPCTTGRSGRWERGKSVEMTHICYVTYEIVKQRKSKNDQNKIFCSIWKLFLSSFNTGRPFCKKKKNQVSGMVISYTFVFLYHFPKTSLPIHQNYLNDWKLYSQRFLKYSQIISKAMHYLMDLEILNNLAFWKYLHYHLQWAIISLTIFVTSIIYFSLSFSSLDLMCLPHHLGKSFSDE